MLLCNLTVRIEKQLKYIRSSHKLDFTALVRESVKLSYLASLTHTRIGALSLIVTFVLWLPRLMLYEGSCTIVL